jgi:hypothetical protein
MTNFFPVMELLFPSCLELAHHLQFLSSWGLAHLQEGRLVPAHLQETSVFQKEFHSSE